MQALSSVNQVSAARVVRAGATKSAKAAPARMVVRASAETKKVQLASAVSAAALTVAALPGAAMAEQLAWLPEAGAGGNLTDGQVYLALFAVQIVGALSLRLGAALYKN
eukprot:CAMPEP_0182853200 /NCGR_PEP_ID=MMETSP0034_2-20130328/575_1 /TAXON_ID=156128 /ORGANISM="Nephroselmis pyriformis, Strain CCMP717" /LENGTH=108 /DNA_ID=CAMNT_0024983959 /DNA_START=41 /DNA_END=367 /DNA_ORIENTATION=-